MAEKRVTDCSFSVIVRGEALDFGAISMALGMDATRTVRTGDVLNRLPEIRAQHDAWFHEEPLNNPDGADLILSGILSRLSEHRQALETLQTMNQVSLRLYVRSDHAQFTYRLMPETLRLLTETGIALDVSSLSWGEV